MLHTGHKSRPGRCQKRGRGKQEGGGEGEGDAQRRVGGPLGGALSIAALAGCPSMPLLHPSPVRCGQQHRSKQVRTRPVCGGSEG